MTPLALPDGESDVGVASFARAVDDAAHDGDADRFLDRFQELVDLVGDGEEIDFDPAAGRAGDHGRALLPQLETLQDLETNKDLFDWIGREGDADRVADAERKQSAESDR